MLPLTISALREIWIPTEEAPPNNQTIIRIIECLGKHPSDLQRYPKELRPYLKILQNIDMEKIPEKAAKINSILLEKYSHLFPEESQDVPYLTIKIGNKEVEVPKNHLLIQSKKFRKMLKSELLEGKSNELILTIGDYDLKAVESFISYLKTGEVYIDEHNVWDLYLLSDEHYLDNLKEHCADFLEQRVDVDNCEKIFDLSKRTHNPKLMLSCLNILVENREEPKVEKFFVKSKKFLDQHPHLISQLLALKIPNKIDLYEKIVDSLSKEIIITSDNFLPYALISSWIGHELLSKACTSFVTQTLTDETFPNIMNKAVDLGLKDIVWQCLKFAKGKIKILWGTTSLSNKLCERWEVFFDLISIGRDMVLQDQTGAIVCSPSVPSYSKPNKRFFDQLRVIGNLCSYFKVHLKIPSPYISLKDLESMDSFPITSLAIHSKNTFDELIPFFNKNPTIREFTKYGKVGNFEELQEFASHFYPLNQDSKIKLTGMELGEHINDQELALFLDQSPFITFIALKSTEITKIPRKDGLKTLICENLSLEEFNPPFPIPNISLRNCPYLKTVEARKSKNIMLVNNPELTSMDFDKPEHVYIYTCKKLNINNVEVDPWGKVFMSPFTTPYNQPTSHYNELTTYFY